MKPLPKYGVSPCRLMIGRPARGWEFTVHFRSLKNEGENLALRVTPTREGCALAWTELRKRSKRWAMFAMRMGFGGADGLRFFVLRGDFLSPCDNWENYELVGDGHIEVGEKDIRKMILTARRIPY